MNYKDSLIHQYLHQYSDNSNFLTLDQKEAQDIFIGKDFIGLISKIELKKNIHSSNPFPLDWYKLENNRRYQKLLAQYNFR